MAERLRIRVGLSERIRSAECELHTPEYSRRARAVDIAGTQFEPRTVEDS